MVRPEYVGGIKITLGALDLELSPTTGHFGRASEVDCTRDSLHIDLLYVPFLLIHRPHTISNEDINIHTRYTKGIMFSLRTLPAQKAAASLCVRYVTLSSRAFTTGSNTKSSTRSPTSRPLQIRSALLSHRSPLLQSSRSYASKSSADGLIEEIQDQYATARDEFEIATEETEKKSLYAEDDRAAAREELDKLKGMYDAALMGENAEEIRGRIGHRIRELDQAVQALEKAGT